MKLTRIQMRDLVESATRVRVLVQVSPGIAAYVPIARKSAIKLLLRAFVGAEPAAVRKLNLCRGAPETPAGRGELLIGG